MWDLWGIHPYLCYTLHMRKRSVATKKKVSWDEESPKEKVQKPLFYKEGAVAPLSSEEEKKYKDELKSRFNKLIKPLPDDELYLRFKNLLATKQVLANKDPLSSLDSCVYSENLFVDEMKLRGLKMPVCYKGKVEVAEPKK